MISILQANNLKDFEEIVQMSNIIWRKHYISIIGSAQTEYMLDKFLSVEALKDQVKDGFQYFIINYNQQAVGYLCIRKENEALFLSKIYVYEEFRGKKIGTSGMLFVDEQAKKLKCKKVYLTVNRNNSNSIKVYEKIGYKNVGTLVKDIGNGFVMDDYKMEKIL
jgi:RimJ/RimL family protein N-acetyltransferase